MQAGRILPAPRRDTDHDVICLICTPLQTTLHPLPLQGGGIAYGTKEGRLRLLRHDPQGSLQPRQAVSGPPSTGQRSGMENELLEAESHSEQAAAPQQGR